MSVNVGMPTNGTPPTVPFPFEGDVFPERLGAMVARTVLSGRLPALQVVHTPENAWLVLDGVNDPNEPDALTSTHMASVVARDPSIAELATLHVGHVADREAPGMPWLVSPFTWDDDA